MVEPNSEPGVRIVGITISNLNSWDIYGHMEVSILWGYLQIIHLFIGFPHYKPSIQFGLPHLWKPPIYIYIHTYVYIYICYLLLYNLAFNILNIPEWFLPLTNPKGWWSEILTMIDSGLYLWDFNWGLYNSGYSGHQHHPSYILLFFFLNWESQ